jgi:hypothetical protein
VGPLALAGVGLVGIGLFSYFGLTGLSKEHDLEQSCMPRCSPSDIDGVRTRYHVADISLGIGVAALAGAILWYVLTPSPRGSSPDFASYKKEP